ncbi:MAG: hypothetical protein LBS36_02250 [Oscillospiraceae bacterium]|nr:hypothetical protein [Oscillospiraceae bacterium]
MDHFVPYEKLSKKKKRELNKKKRKTWEGMSPITRRTKNAKAYNRKKIRRIEDDSSNGGFFYLGNQKFFLRRLFSPE